MSSEIQLPPDDGLAAYQYRLYADSAKRCALAVVDSAKREGVTVSKALEDAIAWRVFTLLRDHALSSQSAAEARQAGKLI